MTVNRNKKQDIKRTDEHILNKEDIVKKDKSWLDHTQGSAILDYDLLRGATVEKGLGGATPGPIAPYTGMGNMYFDSVEYFGKGLSPNAEKIMGDLPNFTNIKPIIQISEVM